MFEFFIFVALALFALLKGMEMICGD